MKGVLWWVLGCLLVLSLGFSLVADNFSLETFFASVIAVAAVVSGMVYVSLSISVREKQSSVKRDLPYCWRAMNQKLISMEGGDKLTWHKGLSRVSEVRTYKIGNKQKDYRAMFGYLSDGGQSVIVIWSIDDEDIVRYNANPSVKMFDDPFTDFKPYEEGFDKEAFLSHFGNSRRRRGFNLKMSRVGSKGPSESQIGNAIDLFGENNE